MSRMASGIPNIEQNAPIPKEHTRSATKIAQHIYQHYQNALPLRRSHALSWIKVSSIMHGYHYFRTDGGVWRETPASRDPRKVRCVVPVMKPRYRWEHGRVVSNQIGCTVTPTTGRGDQSFYRAEYGQATMNHWVEESCLDGYVKDDIAQHLLYYGMCGLYRYVDEMTGQVCMKSIPGPELFPYPYDARSAQQASGLMHVTLVSEDWLAMQDEMYERRTGQKPEKPMAKQSSGMRTGMYAGSPTIASGQMGGGTQSGALALTVWMKPNPINPRGERMFILNDELYGYVGDLSEFNDPSATYASLPTEIINYSKGPDDFWGSGFCEDLIAPQLEANRQMTIIVRSAIANKPQTYYDSDTVDNKMVQREDASFIPFQGSKAEISNKPPVFHFPAAGFNRDTGTVLQLVDNYADKAVGYESRILFGEQEGRTEGGPATSLLNTNAQTPLQSMMGRLFEALKKSYPHILAMVKRTWPEEKQILVAGRQNMARTMNVARSQIPDSYEVRMVPTPLLPGGRNSMAQTLFAMRQMPSPEGGFELNSREFRRSLTMLDMTPPGLDLSDPDEARISNRISLLINDGKQPGISPADGFNEGEQAIENHRLSVQMLREKILEPGYRMYSPMVKKALLAEYQFHYSLTTGATRHPDAFDNDIEEADAGMVTNYLSAAENDMDSMEGMMTINGVPLGAVQ